MGRPGACLLVLSAALLLGSCGGGGANVTSPSAAGFSGRVSDRVGDALPHPGLSVSPDLTDVALSASGGMLTVRITLAPGPVDLKNVLCELLLDTDESPQTGVPDPDGQPFGADFMIEAVYPPFSTTAFLMRLLPSGAGQVIGRADVSFPSSNVMSFQVELRLLGDDDGRMAFRAGAAQWLESTSSGNEIRGVATSLLDSAPDAGVSWGLVR